MDAALTPDGQGIGYGPDVAPAARRRDVAMLPPAAR